MLIGTSFFFLLSFNIVLDRVTGVCYCPVVCLNCYGDFKRTYVYKPIGCIDTESAQECEKANWEIADMQSSLGALAMLFLEDAVQNKNMTMMQAAYVRSLLSLALEDNKPEGDCSNGLLTDTPIKDALAKCFSPELLEQCAMVRDSVGDYQDNIPIHLEHFLGNTTIMYNDTMTLYERSLELDLINGDRILIHQDLKDFIEVVRFRTSIRTARIRCASFAATTIEIAEAGALSLSSFTGFVMSLLFSVMSFTIL